MSEKINSDYKLKVIRGATTSTGNTVEEIENAVVELIDELIRRATKNAQTTIITFTKLVTKIQNQGCI